MENIKYVHETPGSVTPVVRGQVWWTKRSEDGRHSPELHQPKPQAPREFVKQEEQPSGQLFRLAFGE